MALDSLGGLPCFDLHLTLVKNLNLSFFSSPLFFVYDIWKPPLLSGSWGPSGVCSNLLYI